MSEYSLLPLFMLVLLLSWPALAILMAIFASLPRKAPARQYASGRNYWIVIPALNEAKVIRSTVEAALALHTSRIPVRVLVVDDGSDDETADVLLRMDHPRLHVIRRDPPEARHGKGAALNAAFQAVREWAIVHDEVDWTVVGVIDGDGRGAPDLVCRMVDPYFADPAVGAVQCRVRILNRRRIMGLLQDIEFSCVSNAAQSFRDLADCVGMGGNGQFVRLRDLMRFGDEPWSSCLVEDLELGLRLHLAGVRVRYGRAAVISQQGIHGVRRLVRQRARWAQGNLQCAPYLRRLLWSRRVGSLGLLDYLVYLIAPWLTVPMSIIVLGIVGLVVTSLNTGSSMGGLIATGPEVSQALGLWIAMIFLPGIVWALWHRWRIGDVPLWRCLIAGLCYPFFLLIGVMATWRGLANHLVGRRKWDKTERLDEARPAYATGP